MHEVDMTRALLLSLQDWRSSHAPRQPRVSRVLLQVGRFTCVEPEQLRSTWQAACTGSWLAGAELAIEEVALLGRCLPCGATYSPQAEQGYRSPCCGHPLEEILQGRELRILSVDYLLPDADSEADPTPDLHARPADAAGAASAGQGAASDTPGPARAGAALLSAPASTTLRR
ncbi:MAG: hydrogenase maturation nickel metallochaperone HypA [Cyanobacteriota bacterium]|nr:hydrogenase maturation nickel metallochaperone HypA [Cyanobacteriota bacterium]